MRSPNVPADAADQPQERDVGRRRSGYCCEEFGGSSARLPVSGLAGSHLGPELDVLTVNGSFGARRIRDELGVPDVSSHRFRKTVATLIDGTGLSARISADHLGHAKCR